MNATKGKILFAAIATAIAASASMSFTLPVSTKSFIRTSVGRAEAGPSLSSRGFFDAVRLSTYVRERQT